MNIVVLQHYTDLIKEEPDSDSEIYLTSYSENHLIDIQAIPALVTSTVYFYLCVY